MNEKMDNYNRVVMLGHLTREPEFKALPSGTVMCTFGIASNTRIFDKEANKVTEEACFVNVDVFGPKVDACRMNLHKGDQVLVEGHLRLNTWKNKDGEEKSRHSITADNLSFFYEEEPEEIPF
jgi:single-strand DNA-binding protein